MTCHHLSALLLRLLDLVPEDVYGIIKAALLGVWPGCG